MSELISKLKKLAKKEMSQAVWDNDREPGYRYFHCLRTANLAKQIVGETEFLDFSTKTMELIIGASLVHDIRKMEDNHAEAGAKYMERFLKDKKYVSEEDKTKIVKIIANHNCRGCNELPDYVKVVQDADILSRYGAISIFTECYRSGLKNGTRLVMLDRRDKIKEKFTYDYSKLNFDYSKEFIEKEYKLFEGFYEKMIQELDYETLDLM